VTPEERWTAQPADAAGARVGGLDDRGREIELACEEDRPLPRPLRRVAADIVPSGEPLHPIRADVDGIDVATIAELVVIETPRPERDEEPVRRPPRPVAVKVASDSPEPRTVGAHDEEPSTRSLDLVQPFCRCKGHAASVR
jgi:hypothetical protein